VVKGDSFPCPCPMVAPTFALSVAWWEGSDQDGKREMAKNRWNLDV